MKSVEMSILEDFLDLGDGLGDGLGERLGEGLGEAPCILIGGTGVTGLLSTIVIWG